MQMSRSNVHFFTTNECRNGMPMKTLCQFTPVFKCFSKCFFSGKGG